MDEFQNRMEIAYTIYAPVFFEGVSTTETASDARIALYSDALSTTITDGEGLLFVEFQNRMEITYTIYAPVFFEGVSTTEYYSEAYIIVRGYVPSTTITDGEGFLFVGKPGLYGVSETISDGAGHLFVVNVPHLAGASETASDGEGFQRTGTHFLVISVSETTGDGLLEAVFAVTLQGSSTTKSAPNGYVFLQHNLSGPSQTESIGTGDLVNVPHLAGASETASDGEGFQRTGTRFLVLAATETGGDSRFLASTPLPLSGVSDTYSDGEGPLYAQVFFQGSTITETDGDVIQLFTVVNYRGYSAFETVGAGFLFVEVFMSGSSSTNTIANAYLLIGMLMRGTSLTETTSDESLFESIYPRDIPGTSLTISEGDSFLFTDLFLRGPSVAKAEGRGRLSTDVYLRSMEEDTKTDGDGFLFSKASLWGVSDTDASGEGRFIAPRTIPMDGVSCNSTDGDGRLYSSVPLLSASFTWTYGYGFLHTCVYLGPGLEQPIPPSVTETMGFGRFIAPYPRPMNGSSLTVTDGKGRITEAKFVAGTSTTESDGVGEVFILRALMGTSVTLTDSEGRITEAKFVAGTSTTESYGVGELSILQKLDLMKYLPTYYKKSTIMKAIQDAYSTEFGYIYFFLEDFLRQFLTPATATWGIVYWERLVGIPRNDSLSIEQRRARVLTRLQTRWPMTKERMEQLVRTFSKDKQAFIREFFDQYRFEVVFSLTQSVDLGTVYEVIEEAKPAHLSYSLAVRLGQGEKRVFIGSALLTGEEITVYPWTARELTSRGKVFIAAGYNTGVDNMTVYPKGE